MESKRTALTIAIASGKGGVGKTNITTNLGIALAKANQRVCVLDGDTSLANINILLNLNPKATLDQYLNGEKSLEEVIISGQKDIKIVPSATGITDCLNFTQAQRSRLLDCLEQLESEFDYLLIDTAAGIGEGVLHFIESSQYAVVVISPEPTSLTDAFSLIKILTKREYQQPIYILVNMTDSYAHSMEVFKRFAHAVNKYLNNKVRYLGYVPADKAVPAAVSAQQPLILRDPESAAGRCISLLANILLKHFTNGAAPVRKVSQYWRTMMASAPVAATPNENSVAAGSKVTAEPAANTKEGERAAQNDLPPMDDSNAVPNQLSRSEAEDQLAKFIQYYLTEFGTLPQQAIDLILQAYDQGQLPDAARRQIEDHFPSAPNKVPVAPPEIGQNEDIQTEIDSLVQEAEETKARLTELAEYLRTQYRLLYNTDLARPTPVIRAIPSASPSAVIPPSADTEKDRTGLLQSIQFAGAIDKKS